MNFTLEKCKNIHEKQFQTLPRAYFAIIIEYVGLFFIWSKYSIQSCFLPICKILAHVVLAVADNGGVLIWMSISNNQNVFLAPCFVLANCKIPGFIFVLSLRLYRNLHQL